MQVHESNLVFVPVKDSTGREYGRLYFVPNDIGVHIRGAEVQKSLVGFFESLAGLAIMPDGRGADSHSCTVLANLTETFEAMIDAACGTETSTETFREIRPFAVMSDGRFFAEAVTNALGAVDTVVLANLQRINRQIKQETNTPKWRKR